MHEPFKLSLPDHRDTVYLCVVDEEKNCVSFINSIFHSFGSGIVAPNSGVLLHNRGSSFLLDRKQNNVLEASKRPMHTIIPGMLLRENLPVMPFGVMGAHYQPIGQVHFLTNVIDYQMDIQAALDNPRTFFSDGVLSCERGIDKRTQTELSELGHKIEVTQVPHGGGQAIYVDRVNNVLIGGSDPRKDGAALGY